MAVKITGREELEAFLRDKPVQWSRIIAARSALRVLLVALSSGMRGNDLFSILRACFISWAAGKYPAQDMTSAARSAHSAARSAIPLVSSPVHSAARFAISSAELAVFSAVRFAAGSADSAARSADFAARSVARSSAYSAARAAAGSADTKAASAAHSAAFSAAWAMVARDISDLARQGRPVDVSIAPLWLDAVPNWAESDWHKFVNGKVATQDGYAPWIDWYQGVLAGSDHFGPDLTLRIAQQPDEWWSRPPREVNADIAQWLVERDEENFFIPDLEAGTTFGVAEDGRIGIVPSGILSANEEAANE